MRYIHVYTAILFIVLIAPCGTCSINSHYDALQSSDVIELRDLKIGIDLSHSPEHSEFANFIGNYSIANTVLEITDFNQIKDLDILIIPASNQSYTQTELELLKNWLNNKKGILLIGGDSDYEGHFKANNALNPLLEFLGSQLRFDSGAISDPVCNDNAPYRVLATLPRFGDIGAEVNKDLNQLSLHGPNTIFAYINNAPRDLRNANISNVEILFSYSPYSEPLDQDSSMTDTDFYCYYANTGGEYPAVVLEKISGSYVVLSGECIYSDYMGMFNERSRFYSSDNYMFVIRLLNCLYDRLYTTSANTSETSEKNGFTFSVPLDYVPILLGLTIVVFVGRLKKGHLKRSKR